MVLDRGTVAAVLVAVSALAFPAQATAAKPKQKHVPRADLKVTKLEADLGSPAVAVVGTNGLAHSFEIKVTTKNQGDKTADPSVTVVYVYDSRERFHKQHLKVPRLGPNARADQTFTVTSLRPPLGFADLAAIADYNHQIKESDEDNNFHRGPQFAVIARQWNVTEFETIVKLPTSKSVTVASGGFHFRYAGFDHAAEEFHYQAVGKLTNVQTISGVCSGGGSDSATQAPWADSFLLLSSHLDSYEALVKASNAPKYPIRIGCIGGYTYTAQAAFSDLDTLAGFRTFPAMKDTDQQLIGDESSDTLRTEWKWDIRAEIG